MKKIRVPIVEDSSVIRELLEHLILQDPRLEIAAMVGSAEEALRILDRAAPDVISMDIWLPGMNGFEATRKIMEARPTPIAVVSGSLDGENQQITMNAMSLGSSALGVLLTGMGKDGAAGLLQIRKGGGYTIAEHESSTVVYGMPAEAVRLGAACESRPLSAIAPRILELALPAKQVAS